MKRLLAIALLVGACGGGGSPNSASACDAAFAAQVNPIGGGNGVTSLDQAIRDCGTIDNWTASWAKYPNAHGSAVDPRIFLGGRCLEDALASAPLCVATKAVQPLVAPVTTVAPRATAAPVVEPADPYYANCDAVRAAGKAPLRRGSPGYRPALDRDNDGLACE